MEHTVQKGLLCEGDVWSFYSVDEAKAHETECPQWDYVVKRFGEIIGKIWVDKKDLRYVFNDVPVYKEYRVIGLEDNNAWNDLYWILEDENGCRKYELVCMSDFYKGIKK